MKTSFITHAASYWQEEIATKVATNGFAIVCRTTKFENDIRIVKREY